MTQRRTFTAELKTQVVLDLLSGARTPADLCREHQLNAPLLAHWRGEFLERAIITSLVQKRLDAKE